jgi:hypothetical protein
MYYNAPLYWLPYSPSRVVILSQGHPVTPMVIQTNSEAFKNHQEYFKVGEVEVFTLTDSHVYKVEHIQPSTSVVSGDISPKLYLVKLAGCHTLLETLNPSIELKQECKFCGIKFYHHQPLDYCMNHMEEVESYKVVCAIRNKVISLTTVTVEEKEDSEPSTATPSTTTKDGIQINVGQPGLFLIAIELFPRYSPLISYTTN